MNQFKINLGNDILSYGSFIDKDKIIASKRIVGKTNYASEISVVINLTKQYANNCRKLLQLNTISHNLTIAYTSDNKRIGIGGVYSISHKHGKYNKGIYLFQFKEGRKIKDIKLLITKELSLKQNYVTAFDSQASFCYNPKKKEYYLYHRYNEATGKRRCQVFISKKYNKDYKKGILVNLIGKSNIFIYHQYVYFENNQFIGIFKYYIGINVSPKNRKYLKATSNDGINFKINNMDFLGLKDNQYICQNHEKKSDNNIYYIVDTKCLIIKKSDQE